MRTYGTVVRLEEARRFGYIRPADSHSYALPFLFSEFAGSEEDLQVPLAVTFREAVHPRDVARKVACEVRLATDVPTIAGEISGVWPSYGFVRLADDRDAYFPRYCTSERDLQWGQRVECAVIPGKDDRMFALTLRRAAAPAPGPKRAATSPRVVTCGAASQRGKRASKSVNDDSFLVSELAGGMWLLAVADGVSKPSHGWWASDKCTELLWRSASEFAPRLLDASDRDQELTVMGDWIRLIHEDFLSERRRQTLPDYQSATTTLTYVVIRARRVLYANSGDSPLYVFQKKRGSLKKVIDVWARSRGKVHGQTHLTQHMAASKKEWHPQSGTADLEPGDLLVLCSDGVASGDRSNEKHQLLNRSLADNRRDLQQRVTDVLAQIAEMGEADDLTLLAFKPEERP